MNSIRRRTTTMVALSMGVLLLVGGVVLALVLRGAMTAQFDGALVARAAALQTLTHFDGTKVEMDFAREAMPRYAHPPSLPGEAEFFVVWVREEDGGRGWRTLERSDSLRDDGWPGEVLRDGAPGARDLPLPGGDAGRAVLIEFVAASEPDEETDHGGESQVELAATMPHTTATPPPTVRLLVALPRAPLDRLLAVIAWCIAGVGGVLTLASIVVSRWTVSRGLVPLSDLSGRVQSLGPDTLGTRFDAAGLPTELRPIAEQLSALLARLEEAFEREKRFSAAASHELRTPIAELRMLLEVAVSQPRASEEWSRTTETALGVLARAQSLCETLLRLSRASADHATPDPHARAVVGPLLAAQAARVIAMHGGDARRVRIEPGVGLVARVEDATLASIIGNLLDNALRHGHATPNDPVIVRRHSIADGVCITITNPAPGLTPEDVSHFFEPFWRKDPSRRDQNGFGLGLAVARTLARAIGGDLTASMNTDRTLNMTLTLQAAYEHVASRA